jgi:hypothetical protein
VKPELARFFTQIEPLLFGEAEVDAVEARLGPSASGSENLDFYRVLVARNFAKILRELFPAAKAATERLHPKLWPTLVREYTRACPPGAELHDPNLVGLRFPDWLAERRERVGDAEQSPALEELADYQLCCNRAAHAPDELDDPFEARIFVRLYTYPVTAIASAVARGLEFEIGEPRPAALIVYRSLGPEPRVRRHVPTGAELAALARHQGAALPPALAELPAESVDAGLASLVRLGILDLGEP